VSYVWSQEGSVPGKGFVSVFVDDMLLLPGSYGIGVVIQSGERVMDEDPWLQTLSVWPAANEKLSHINQGVFQQKARVTFTPTV
jgi:hypothetical protein